jgi:uncharacterized protein YcaQ
MDALQGTELVSLVSYKTPSIACTSQVRCVARFEPIIDRKNKTLSIKNWWWEEGTRPGKEMGAALEAAIHSFMQYLQADSLTIPPDVKSSRGMSWLVKL